MMAAVEGKEEEDAEVIVVDGEAGPKGVGADDHQVLIVPIVYEAEEVIVDGEGAMMGEMGRNQRKDRRWRRMRRKICWRVAKI